VIAPLAPDIARPRWSVMIPTYHCARFLRATLRSVLVQAPGPHEMQIEVVDDHSTRDDPEGVVRDVAGDRVGFFRQPENRGHSANFDTCLQRSRGRIVHLLHGDDGVRDGFYATLGRAFESNAGVGAAFCRTIYMDERGHWTSFSPLIQREAGVLSDGFTMFATRQPAQPPSIVVRREVYERLGGFDRRLKTCAEDWEMFARIAAHYPVWHEPEPLALYRKHPDSLMGRGLRSGQNARDARTAIATYRRYAASTAPGVMRGARELAALWMLGLARRARESRDDATWFRQMWEAIATSRSPSVVRRFIRETVAQGRAVLERAGEHMAHAEAS
jgi:glycosyltransferase involved in cell wall biosynthesis